MKYKFILFFPGYLKAQTSLLIPKAFSPQASPKLAFFPTVSCYGRSCCESLLRQDQACGQLGPRRASQGPVWVWVESKASGLGLILGFSVKLEVRKGTLRALNPSRAGLHAAWAPDFVWYSMPSVAPVESS